MKKNKNEPLSSCVTNAIQEYLSELNGQDPTNFHQFFLAEVEKPFLKVVMEHVQGNQTHAAKVLGINRNTLRKKLIQYDLA